MRGDAGPRAGDRLRRGLILIRRPGRAPTPAGRMIAGTLAIGEKRAICLATLWAAARFFLVEAHRFFRRASAGCGEHDLVAARLLADYVAQASEKLARLFRRPLRRLAGDLAALGKGEILLPRT